MPFLQRGADEGFSPVNGAVVIVSKQFAGSGQDIVALLGAVSLARALGCNGAEEFSGSILTAAVIPVVVRGRDEVLTKGVDDVRI